MTKKNDFPFWDVSPGNEMCFVCERSGSKEKMCSWIRNCTPIPGWLAVDSSEVEGVQSYKIFRCPKFLDSPDDPGMTRAEYLQSCRDLVINLYRKVKEYRHLYYKMMKERSVLASQLELEKKETHRLRRKIAADEAFEKILNASAQVEETKHDQ
nr:hypothetical protein [Clostridia bacterium]